MMSTFLTPPGPSRLGSSLRTVEPQASPRSRRAALNEADSPSLDPKEYHSKSFWDAGAYGVESLISLQSTDGEKWIRTQQETFANWVNDRLKSGAKVKVVTDLTVDLQDGTVLARLLENLTSKKIKGYNKVPRLTAHKMDNLDQVFRFMQSNGIKVIGIGSHNIYKGDIKLILGLIWTLIQKYQLRMGGTQVSTKAVMMDWLKALLPSRNITNLSTDWNDGRALVALINEAKPGIAPDASKLNPTRHLHNCNLAIDIAFNHLKIPKLISADNLSSSTIDELSIITYLSYFRDPARARLLKWVRRILPQFNITNFLGDWIDGQAFAALTKKFFPDLLPHSASIEKDNPLENIEVVLDTLEKKLGITTSFTAKNLLTRDVEDLQVMTLVLRIRYGKLQPLANEITVSGPGLNEAVVGKQTFFTVNTMEAGPGQLTVHANYQSGRKVDCSVREKGSTATVTYCPRLPGKISIDVCWSGDPVPCSPFTVIATDSLMVKIIDFDHHKRVVHTNEPIELCLNTERAGQGTLTAHLRYGTDQPIPAKVVKSSDSITKLQYIPQKSGQPVLNVFWNGEEMSHLTITYTVIDSNSYRVVSRPGNKVFRILETVKFSIQTKGELLNALQMTAIMDEDDVQVPIRFDNIDRHVGHAIFHPTLPGIYRIEIACIDQLVEGSPFQVEVVDPSRCKVVGDIPKFLQANMPYTFEVDVNHAGSGALSFECDEHQDDTTFDASVGPPDQSGISKVKITPHNEGKFLVSFKFQGTEIPGCPFRVLVCDPSRCRVSGEALKKRSAMVGKPIRFKVIVDPIERLKPMIKASGPSAKYTPEIREKEENVYTVQFTPWEIGTHDISITYGDFHVPNSPFLVSVTTFDTTICSATGSGLQKASSGIPAQFVVLAKQEGLLKDGTLQIKVQGVVNGVECKVRARDNRNGSYNVAYLVQDPGAYLISILAEGKPIAGSPFRLTALPGPTADKCHMYGPILQPDAVLTIGNPMDFTVDTSAAGVGELSVKAVGPGNIQARVYLAKVERKGIYNVKLDPIRHGKYRVSVKWSGEHIPGSPFLLKIYPGADSSKCRAYGPGLEDGLVGRASMFTIETRDAGAGTLKVRLHGVKNAFKIDIKPVDQRDIRTLQANYNPRKPGDYLVTIKWSDKHIPGSPFRVKIVGDGTAIIEGDSKLKPIPQVESTNLIVEELEDSNWGDDEEKVTTTPSGPAPRKRKKKQKKSHTQIEEPKGSPIPPNFSPKPNNEMPTFNPTSMRTNYKQAFAGGGQNRQVMTRRSFKTKKSQHSTQPQRSAPPTLSMANNNIRGFHNTRGLRKLSSSQGQRDKLFRR